MLVPHRRENPELGDGRRAADEGENALILLAGEAVRGDEVGGDFLPLGGFRLRGPRFGARARWAFYGCLSHGPSPGFHTTGPGQAPRARWEAIASCRLLEVIDEACEQAAAVGRTERGFDVILRMRHQAEHVAPLVEHSGDGVG